MCVPARGTTKASGNGGAFLLILLLPSVPEPILSPSPPRGSIKRRGRKTPRILSDVSLGSPSAAPNWQGQSGVCAMLGGGRVRFAQLLSSLLQGSHTAAGSRRCGGEKTGSGIFFFLPSSASPASTGAPAEPGEGSAAFGFASAGARRGGGSAGIPAPCRAGFSPPPLVLSQ